MGLATSEPPKKAPQDRPSPEHAQSASVARTPTETSTETTLDDNALEAAPKADPNAEERLSKSRTYVLIAIVAFTMIMSSGGQQGLNIALPVIQEELGILESNLQWVASAYSLTWGCLLLLSGRIADVYGRKLCFIIGIAWYAIWCLVGSLMHSGAALIVTRALAGAGAAMGIPASMGLIATHIHGRQRATAFAVFSAGAPLGGAMGMTLGGVLTAFTNPTWRAVLWIFTGLAALIAIAAIWVVPADKVRIERKAARARGEKRAEKDKIDWIGAAIITCGLVLVQFTVSDGMSAPKGWRTPYIPVLFCVGVILVVAFFFWEHHVVHKTSHAPLLSLGLFTRARGRLAAIYFVGFVMWMGFVSIGYHATLYYQQVQMTGTIGALLRFLPTPISGLICNFLVAKVIHTVDAQLLICLGVGATGLSSVFFAVSGRDQLYWTFPFNASYLVVLGADCFMPTGAIFVSRMAFPGEQSVAAALFQTLLQLGASFGLTLTTVIATATTERATAAGKEHVDALLEGFHASFWLSAALCFTALLLALVTLRGIGIVSQVTRETFKKRADKEEVVGAGPGVEEKAESSEVKESAEEPQPVPLLNEQSEKS